MKMLQKLTMAVLIFGVSAGAVRAMDDITDAEDITATMENLDTRSTKEIQEEIDSLDKDATALVKRYQSDFHQMEKVMLDLSAGKPKDITMVKIRNNLAQDVQEVKAMKAKSLRLSQELARSKRKDALQARENISLNAKQYDKFLKAKQRHAQPQSTSTSSSSAANSATQMSDDNDNN